MDGVRVGTEVVELLIDVLAGISDDIPAVHPRVDAINASIKRGSRFVAIISLSKSGASTLLTCQRLRYGQRIVDVTTAGTHIHSRNTSIGIAIANMNVQIISWTGYILLDSFN